MQKLTRRDYYVSMKASHEISSSLGPAIDANGGLSKVAQLLGVSTNRLANWIKRGVPAERCPDVEAATGIRCEELRPDVNWQVLRAPGGRNA